MAIDYRHTLIFICDGGYRQLPGKPGVATYAWLVRRAGCYEAYRELGVACRGRGGGSLQAELAAMVAALRWVRTLPLPPYTRVEVWSDCLGAVQRVTGLHPGRRWPGKEMLYRAVLRHTMWLRAHGHEVTFRKVPRSEVSKADKLCWRAYNLRAARSPKSLTRFVRHEKPSAIPRRNDLYAKLFTKVGRPPDSELPATRTK